MGKKNILFIDGIPDSKDVLLSQISKDGNIKWLFNGSAHLSQHLENDLFYRSMIMLDTTDTQELPRKMIHGVFNQISDPDTHRITLHKAEDFYQAVSAHVPFFNIPSHVMRTTRDNISRLLYGIDKLYVPKTVRIQPKSPADIYDVVKKENFEFPVIFRQAGDHAGISTVKVDDETEQFYAFALDGRDYYLTQFVDYAEDNMYRFYRLAVVDGEVFISHALISEEWMVHGENQLEGKESRHFQEDVAKRFTSDMKLLLQPVITEIYKRLELDYFCIDCYIDKDMNILVFEINVNIVFSDETKKSIFSKHIERIRTALIKMLTNKMQ